MALAAFAPEAVFDVEQAPSGISDRLQAFMARISVKADEGLLQYYPKSWPARLEVATPSGKHERLVIHVPGDPQRPFDEPQVAAKFRRVTAPLIGERAADDLLRFSLAALGEDGGAGGLPGKIERACAAAAGAGRMSL
jgi:2-methylcitrate dehydratase PrpD